MLYYDGKSSLSYQDVRNIALEEATMFKEKGIKSILDNIPKNIPSDTAQLISRAANDELENIYHELASTHKAKEPYESLVLTSLKCGGFAQKSVYDHSHFPWDEYYPYEWELYYTLNNDLLTNSGFSATKKLIKHLKKRCFELLDSYEHEPYALEGTLIDLLDKMSLY